MWAAPVFVSLALADPAVVFESGPVRPLALSEQGELLVANLPDGQLDLLDPATGSRIDSVAVGLDPVAVAVHGSRAWVVDQVSDSVSVVELGANARFVAAVLQVGDEPSDIVFASDRAYITAAHRGRALAVDPQSATPSVGRADVWVFDAEPEPALSQVVSLFGDTPRALAVSPDESTVYAAVFRSGNRTAVVPEHIVCDGGAMAAPCQLEGYSLPGGLPAPNTDFDGVPGPETGLLVRHDGVTWRDPLGRDWAEGIRFELPDLDVFALDATGPVVTEIAAHAGVGTVLYAMATTDDGDLLVAGTEARNEVRFEPGVRGHQHESRITAIAGSQVTALPLNPHIDYGQVPSPAGVEEASIAQPVALDIGPEGQVWIAGYGSAAIAVHTSDELLSGSLVAQPDRLVPTLGGPSGVLIDDQARVVYVYARFDNAVQAFDLDTRAELWRRFLHTPEEPSVIEGRALFHDARASSTNGEASCGVCHVFGHDDGLAWDLGDPGGSVQLNPNPVIEGDTYSSAFDFHPLKGPMHTQTLRGIRDAGPLHWRGDRTDMAAFAGAFEGLLGDSAPADATVMTAIEAWALAIDPPPNPYLNLDGSRTAEQATSWAAFSGGDCIECHLFDPDQGHWGTDGSVAANFNATQFMKIPSLRQAYTKLGLYWTGNEPRVPGPGDPLGPQVKGFGLFHDGATGTLPDEVLQAVLAFPSNHHPAVGTQIVVPLVDNQAQQADLDELRAVADAQDCDLVAHAGPIAWLWDGTDWISDRDRSTADRVEVLSLGPVRFLCAPVGTGERLALDRDWDGIHNGADNCPAIDNPDQLDTDDDGEGDLCDSGSAPEPVDTGTGGSGPGVTSRETVTRSCGCGSAGPSPVSGLSLLFAVAWIRRRS